MSSAIPYPLLEHYLTRLARTSQADVRIRADAEGRAQGRYFNATLTSAFQAIREIDTGCIVGYEGFARSYSERDQGLCVWRLLDHAANDDESVALDRLCRMLHSINFFRQPQAVGRDLYLSLHARLLAAVGSDHGGAFRRILKLLELPQERVILQLPVAVEHQGWLMQEVADNYQRNGFRVAANVSGAAQGLALTQRMRLDVIKVDTRSFVRDPAAVKLVLDCAQRGIRLIFKRVENTHMLDMLKFLAEISEQPILAQGYLWDLPLTSLAATRSYSGIMLPVSYTSPIVGAA